MKSETTILYEYEEVLTRKKLNFMTVFEGSLQNRREVSGVIWRYAIEHILHWTPEQALMSLDQKIVKALCLDKTYSQMEIDCSSRNFFDFRSVLQYAYPETIHYNIEQQALTEYNRIMKLEEFKYDTEKHKFPKGFFRGDEGCVRSSVILIYAINTFIGNISDYDLYHFFGEKAEAKQWLDEHRLGSGAVPGYDSPLEYLHYALYNTDEASANKLLYMNEWLKDKCDMTKELG